MQPRKQISFERLEDRRLLSLNPAIELSSDFELPREEYYNPKVLGTSANAMYWTTEFNKTVWRYRADTEQIDEIELPYGKLSDNATIVDDSLFFTTQTDLWSIDFHQHAATHIDSPDGLVVFDGSRAFVRDSSGLHGYDLRTADKFFVAEDGIYLGSLGDTIHFKIWGEDSLEATDLVERWDVAPQQSENSLLEALNHGRDRGYFFVSNELWVTDGTMAGTQSVHTFEPGSTLHDIFHLEDGRALIQRASQGEPKYTLWATDGTPEGTSIVEAQSSRFRIQVVHDFAYLGNGKRLDLGSLLVEQGDFVYNDDVYAVATFSENDRSWIFLGDPYDSCRLRLVDESSNELPFNLGNCISVQVHGKFGDDIVGTSATLSGTNWWHYDTVSGELHPDVPLNTADEPDLKFNSSQVVKLANSADMLVFADGLLLSTDATPVGTRIISRGPRRPEEVIRWDDTSANSEFGRAVYQNPSRFTVITDGTTGGTIAPFTDPPATYQLRGGVVTIDHGSVTVGEGDSKESLFSSHSLGRARSTNSIEANGHLFFNVVEDGHFQEFTLWVTDGTSAGTRQLSERNAAPAIDRLNEKAVVYSDFAGTWLTDGTVDGKRQLTSSCSIGIEIGHLQMGPTSESISLLLLMYDRVEFISVQGDGTVSDPVTILREELQFHATNGFVPTFPILDPRPYACRRLNFDHYDIHQPAIYTVGGNTLVQVENTIWTTDGTAQNTTDFLTAPFGTYKPSLDSPIFFVNSDRQLVATDGTMDGTTTLPIEVRSADELWRLTLEIRPMKLGIGKYWINIVEWNSRGDIQESSLWITDGSVEGTKLASDGMFVDSHLVNDRFEILETKIGTGSVYGANRVQAVDQDGAVTVLLDDFIVTESTQFNRNQRLIVGNSNGGRGATQVWLTDGTESGTIKAFESPFATLEVISQRSYNDEFVFFETHVNGSGYKETWVTGGTGATRLRQTPIDEETRLINHNLVTVRHNGIYSSPLSPEHNYVNPVDTTGDGVVVPRDALVVINELINRDDTDPVTGALNLNVNNQYFIDVNQDLFVSPIDAVRVINALNRREPSAASMLTQNTTAMLRSTMSVAAWHEFPTSVETDDVSFQRRREYALIDRPVEIRDQAVSSLFSS